VRPTEKKGGKKKKSLKGKRKKKGKRMIHTRLGDPRLLGFLPFFTIIPSARFAEEGGEKNCTQGGKGREVYAFARCSISCRAIKRGRKKETSIRGEEEKEKRMTKDEGSACHL